jgi:hypothetical protein
MPRFWGALEPTELPALVRFLHDVGATGCLRLAGERRPGELWLDGGRLVAARSGTSRGRAALEAVAFPEGEFVFTGNEDPPEPDPDLVAPRAGDPLRRLQAAAGRWARLGPLLGARWVLAPSAGDVGGEPLTLDRESLRALLAVGRGEQRLEAIAAGGDLLATGEALRSLHDLGLVRAEGVSAEGPPTVGSPAEGVPPGEQPPGPAEAGEGPPPRSALPEVPGSARSGGLRFRPTATWQEVPPGTAVPPGGEYRMELGGRVLARWPDSPPEGEAPEGEAPEGEAPPAEEPAP